jgi:hypothetical protein
MFEKILIANRGDNGGQPAVAAQPDCMARLACAGDLAAMEPGHV